MNTLKWKPYRLGLVSADPSAIFWPTKAKTIGRVGMRWVKEHPRDARTVVQTMPYFGLGLLLGATTDVATFGILPAVCCAGNFQKYTQGRMARGENVHPVSRVLCSPIEELFGK